MHSLIHLRIRSCLVAVERISQYVTADSKRLLMSEGSLIVSARKVMAHKSNFILM